MIHRLAIVFATLFVVVFMQSGGTFAQAVQRPPLGADRTGSADRTVITAQPVILTSPDIGFRLIRMDGQTPVGEVVIRINGAWVSPEISR